MRLDEFRRSEHAAQVDRGRQLLESLQEDPKVMKQFLANYQLPGDLPSEEIAYALSSIRIKVCIQSSSDDSLFSIEMGEFAD